MSRNKPDPSYAPVYCAMYPDLKKIVEKFGYALTVHGSLQRDFDLVCIPWRDGEVGTHREVLDAIESEFAVRSVDDGEKKPHGRTAYALSIGYGECYMDLSFM